MEVRKKREGRRGGWGRMEEEGGVFSGLENREAKGGRKVHVAVLNRNRILFRHVFRAHCQV